MTMPCVPREPNMEPDFFGLLVPTLRARKHKDFYGLLTFFV